MELAILITVNLLTAFVIYVAFSIRFRMALEKERKDRVPRKFYDNIQMVIQYVNTAMQTVDKRTESFYRLVLKSEDILKRLEKANDEFEKNLKKSRRKRKDGPVELTISEKVDKGAAERSHTGGPALFSGAATAGGSSNDLRQGTAPGGSEEALSGEARHVHRLLSAMRDDVVQITDPHTDANAGNGSLSSESGPFAPDVSERALSDRDRIAGARFGRSGEAPKGFLARVGSLVGRALGIDSSAFASPQGPELEASAVRRSEPGPFDREIERMKNAPGQVYEEDASGKGDPAHRVPGRTTGRDYYVSGFDPDEQSRQALTRAAPSSRGASPDIRGLDNGVRDAESVQEPAARRRPAGKGFAPLEESVAEDPLAGNPADREIERGFSDAKSSSIDSEQSGDSAENRIRKVQEFLDSTGLNLLDTTPQTRAVLIRELGSLGFEPNEIVRATRFPPSEVAVVMQLPEGRPDQRRRVRKTPT